MRFDFSALGGVDTTGAMIIYRVRKRPEAAGIAVDLSHAPKRVAALIRTVAVRDRPCPPPLPPPGP